MTHLVSAFPLFFEPGDRLTLEEFLARWEQMPGLKFAELIDGIVHMPSPLSMEHGRRDGQVQLLLSFYALRTGVCEMISNATWLMAGSAPQPDTALRLLPRFGGRTKQSGKLAAGPPELVVEVSSSSRSIDLGPKLALYQRAGVLEYLAVLLEEQRMEWRRLVNGSYLPLAPGPGVLKSSVFPGLWLDEAAFWANDSKQLIQVLEQGLASEECRLFTEGAGGDSPR